MGKVTSVDGKVDDVSKISFKRWRQYEPDDRIILPYKKKPSIRKFEYQTYNMEEPANLSKALKLDQI